jgi:hypothetical protein
MPVLKRACGQNAKNTKEHLGVEHGVYNGVVGVSLEAAQGQQARRHAVLPVQSLNRGIIFIFTVLLVQHLNRGQKM